MNTQYLETPAEAEQEAQSRAMARAELGLPTEPDVQTEVAPPQAASTETTPAQAVSEEERRRVLYNIQHGRWGYNARTSARRMFGSKSGSAMEPNQLQQMPIEDVLGILRTESTARAKRQKLFVGIFVGIIALFALVSILTHNTHLFGTLGSYVSLLTIGAAASQQQKLAAVTMTRFNDVRAIGPLAEALEFQDKDVVRMAAQALTNLLPRMQASDTSHLSPAQRHCLNRALRGKNIELILAILKAWEQVGDTSAISEVEKLAAGRGHGGRNPKVVAAAEECLPFLRQSAERQQVGAQLLRAADAGPVSPDTLLRPSMPHTSADPVDQLLRPTDSAG